MLYNGLQMLSKWLNNAVLVAVRTEGEETARERLVAPRVAAEPHADHRHLSTRQRTAPFVRPFRSTREWGVLYGYSQPQGYWRSDSRGNERTWPPAMAVRSTRE